MMKHYEKVVDRDDWYLAMMKRRQSLDRRQQAWRIAVDALKVLFVASCAALVIVLFVVTLRGG